MAQKAPPMTKGSFGERLRREREMRGVTLEEITAATRIGTRYLEALETEQWDHLPGGVFNRGFVRAVARFLGLDEDNLVAEYAMAVNERGSSVTIWTEEPAAAKPGRPWLRWVAAFVVLLALGTGAWYGWQRYMNRRSTAHFAQAPATNPRAASGASAVAPPGPARAEGTPIPRGSGPTSPVGPAAKAPATLELRVEAVKTTAVSVLADGRPVYESILVAGQSQTFRAQQEFRLSTSSAGALLLELNGQTLPPLGPPGTPGKITLTRQDLKAAAGGTH